MQNNSFGAFLSSARKKAGFRSQTKLAKASGVTKPTISRLEGNIHSPSAETLAALAGPLKLSIDELMKAAGYLTTPVKPNQTSSGYLEAELMRLLKENNRLHTEVKNLKESIKLLTKGW